MIQQKCYYSRITFQNARPLHPVWPGQPIRLSSGELSCIIHSGAGVVEAESTKRSFRLAHEYFEEYGPSDSYALESLDFEPMRLLTFFRETELRPEIIRVGVVQMPLDDGVRISGSIEFPPYKFVMEHNKYLNSITVKLHLEAFASITTWYKSGAITYWDDGTEHRDIIVKSIIGSLTRGW